MQTTFRLNLNDYLDGDELCLVRRSAGEAILARMVACGIVWEDMEADGPIVVVIPENIMTMNRTFFEAVWGTRVVQLMPAAFWKHYSFDTTPHIQSMIEHFVRRLFVHDAWAWPDDPRK